jgi:plastocyanin
VSRRDTNVAKASSLLPGDRTSKTFTVRKGRYRFFCALSNHEELGMYGTLIVK